MKDFLEVFVLSFLEGIVLIAIILAFQFFYYPLLLCVFGACCVYSILWVCYLRYALRRCIAGVKLTSNTIHTSCEELNQAAPSQAQLYSCWRSTRRSVELRDECPVGPQRVSCESQTEQQILLSLPTSCISHEQNTSLNAILVAAQVFLVHAL